MQHAQKNSTLPIREKGKPITTKVRHNSFEQIILSLIEWSREACYRRGNSRDDQFLPRIDVAVDAQHGLVTIQDNGAGFTRGALRRLMIGENDETPSLFWIVAEVLEIHTCAGPGENWRFMGTDTGEYALEPQSAGEQGTRVSLHLNPASALLVEPFAVERILRRTCCLLAIPLYFNHKTLINDMIPPWRRDDLEGTLLDAYRMDFARAFSNGFPPLCCFPIERVDGIRGLLWVYDHRRQTDEDHRELILFHYHIEAPQNVPELLPNWATFVGGVVVASNPEGAAPHVGEALVNGLVSLGHNRLDLLRAIQERHGSALERAALAAGQELATVA